MSHNKTDLDLFCEYGVIDDDAATVESEDELDAPIVTVCVDEALSVRMIQAAHAFGSSGADQSGGVLWGAAHELARYVVRKVRDGALRGRFCELGCGLALPSLSISLLGTARSVIATDRSKSVLRRASRNANLNDITGVRFELLDWDGEDNDTSIVADVVIASDVVYGRDCVQSLAKTLESVCANEGGTAIIASRDGRLGVAEFERAMKECSVFSLEETIQVEPPTTLPEWAGENPDRVTGARTTIHVFRKRPVDRARTLSRLAEKRAELARCKEEMAQLQGDLKSMSLAVQADMQTLLATLTTRQMASNQQKG